MTKQRIYLSSPHMSGDEQKYLQQAFNQNWIAPLGPNVDAFEKELANYCGAGHAAVLSSGSAAIHLALIMLGVGSGDYVLCQSFTFAATAFPILYQGATPVFIDSESKSWNMDPELLEKAIIDCMNGNNKEAGPGPKKPKAILPVHLYGMPYDVEKIHGIAEKYSIPIIEDAAEALGSTYNEEKCGSFGLLSILSFNGNKIITSSGGGALLSDDEELIKKSRFLATQARDQAAHYEHSQIGYNYRMSNIVAGIGRGQLEVIDERVKSRRKVFLYYKENLSHIPGISFLEEPSEKYFSNRWLTSILIDKNQTGFSNEDLRIALGKENIESRPLWKPMHMQPIFKSYPAYLNTSPTQNLTTEALSPLSKWRGLSSPKLAGGEANNLFSHGLCLPSGSNMTDTDLTRIIDTIKKLHNKS